MVTTLTPTQIKFKQVQRLEADGGSRGGVLDVSIPQYWASTKSFIIPTSNIIDAQNAAIHFFEREVKDLIEDVVLVNYEVDETQMLTISQMDISISNLNGITPDDMHEQQNNVIDIDPPNIDLLNNPFGVTFEGTSDDPFNDIEENFLFGCGRVNYVWLPAKLRVHVWMAPGTNDNCFFEACAAFIYNEKHRAYPQSEVEIEALVTELRDTTGAPQGPASFVTILGVCNLLKLNLTTHEMVTTSGVTWTKAISTDRIITKFAGPSMHLFKTHETESTTTGPPAHHILLVKSPDKFTASIFCSRCSFWYTKTYKKHHEAKCVKCSKCNRPHNKDFDCQAENLRNSKRPREDTTESTTTDLNQTKKQRRRSVRAPHKAKSTAAESYLKNKYFLDFETFTPPESDRFVVYSYSIMSTADVDMVLGEFALNKEYVNNLLKNKYTYSGEDALEKCMTQINTLPEGSTVVTYNGSKFDLFFIFQHLVENTIPIHEILRKGKENKIITMCAGVNKVKYWDMCLFTFASLARVCESVGVPRELQKQGFDHNSIKTWGDVHRLQVEIANYNFYDVLCLGIAYKNFGETLAVEFNQDISECCTLSQLAYKIWTGEYMSSEVCADISLPTNGVHYKWMRRALFGGRCQPQQKYFESKQLKYAHQISERSFATASLESAEVRALFDGITDAKTYLDVSSLYPAASCYANMYPMGKYKECTKITSLDSLCTRFRKIEKYNPMTNDQSTMSANCQKLISIFTRSLFEVDVICPNNINVPFLLERGPSGELVQNLRQKYRQVYDGVTLMMAQHLGYRVTNIYKRVTWERLGTPLERFMVDVYKRKSESPKNSAAYMVWKLLMNSLTGKMSQQWINTSYSIHTDEESIVLGEGQSLESHELINHSKTERPIAIGATISDPSKMPSKPIQMGVWILSISRCMMVDMYLKMNLMHSVKSMSAYGDTDSFLPPYSVYKATMSRCPAIFGEKLGLLADEISGGKIVRGWFISPKVYMVEYITPDLKLKWKIRAKGIPRANKEIPVATYRSEQKNLEQLIEWHNGNPLSRTLFSFMNDNNLTVSDTLDDVMFDAMITGHKVKCVYGTMKRGLVHGDFNNCAGAIAFNPQCYRTVNEKDWWKSGARSNPGNTQDYSVPEGHYEFKKMNKEVLQ